MTFRKVDIIFVVLALLVVGGVALLPSPRDRWKRIVWPAMCRPALVPYRCSIPSGRIACIATRGRRDKALNVKRET